MSKIAMNKNDQQFMVQRIRSQYLAKESDELDDLRELDKKVKHPANVFACVFGSIGAISMGAGMSLVMTDIGATVGIAQSMVVGIVSGVIGLAMALVNYPIYKSILAKRKRKYGGEIIALSDKIMNE